MPGPVLWPHAAFAHIERNNTELGRLWCMPQRLSCQCHQRLQSMFPMRNTSIHVWLDVFGIHGMSTIDFTLVFHWFGGQRTMVSFSSHVDVSINWLSSVMFCIRFSFTKGELILHISAFAEVVISAMITILMYEPLWSFRIHSCEVTRLADWYTLFHNPTPNYEQKLHCTQEAVYPLWVITTITIYLLRKPTEINVYQQLFRISDKPWF